MSKDNDNSTQKILKDKKTSQAEKLLALNERKEANREILSKTPPANFMAKVPDALLLGETEELEKGYTTRVTVIASMPHSKPKEHIFTRKNGNYTLHMMGLPDIGLPYGTIPRLLLAWITTEAVRTKSRILSLGKSLADFLEALGLAREGKRIKALKDQMRRLFSTTISFVDETKDHFNLLNMHVTKRVELWWSPKDPEQPGLGESTIVLDEDFFNEIVKSPIPFFMEALQALRKSPLALDIYLWLTYKNSYANNITSISWESLQAQFGADYPKTSLGKRHFKSKFLSALKKIAIIYPEARKLQALDEGILFVPGLPHVPKTKPTPLKNQQ